MACAVRSCRNEVLRRPDLCFFYLPKQNHLKDEWLEILGLEPTSHLNNIKVCELHFKPKDFCDSKRNKQLKTHAVPVLRLGKGQSEPINSDDEFMDFNSDDDIIEVLPPKENIKIVKEETNSVKSEQKQNETEELEQGRRPSRRAAREAAKKISHSVRSFNPRGGNDDATFSPTVSSNRGSAAFTMPQNRQRRRRSNSSISGIKAIHVDLVMECHEEILSPVQAEALLKAQLEYNMVMKTLRSLKASNVRIILSKEPYSQESQPSTTAATALKVGNNPPTTVNATTNSANQKPAVVPMALSSSSLSITQTSAVA